MPADARGREIAVMALIGAGEGILLGGGLELCFGVGRYLLIMLFGALGGAGIALMVWMGMRSLAAAGGSSEGRAQSIRAILSGAASAAVVFIIYFLWRVLPLIQEEIRFSR